MDTAGIKTRHALRAERDEYKRQLNVARAELAVLREKLEEAEEALRAWRDAYEDKL